MLFCSNCQVGADSAKIPEKLWQGAHAVFEMQGIMENESGPVPLLHGYVSLHEKSEV